MPTRLRPSPALIVATPALFVAIGGSAYAASTISGSSIKNHSIAGRKVIDNTLTGRQIKESRLATVPRAASAKTVGGITMRKVFYAPKTKSATPTPILHLGGLVLTATCGNGDLEVVMTSTAATPTWHRRCSTPQAAAPPTGCTVPISGPTARFTSASLSATETLGARRRSRTPGRMGSS
ncbi:MAG TPA: hypothetical protein VHV79_05815 [Mycobacteriales bacterium]|nr:hypothetical protein [Mycobacteriales bacterium]